MTFNEQLEKVKLAAAEFPVEFGLRAFPGKRFSVSIAASYVSGGQVTLYLAIWEDELNRWSAFVKGTPAELRREVVA